MVLAHVFFMYGVDIYLGDVLTVAFSHLWVDTQLEDDVVDGTENCRLCNFDIRFHLFTLMRLMYGSSLWNLLYFYCKVTCFFSFLFIISLRIEAKKTKKP